MCTNLRVSSLPFLPFSYLFFILMLKNIIILLLLLTYWLSRPILSRLSSYFRSNAELNKSKKQQHFRRQRKFEYVVQITRGNDPNKITLLGKRSMLKLIEMSRSEQILIYIFNHLNVKHP